MMSSKLMKIIPLSFIVGATMELFMIKTGFYEIALRKEALRRADREHEELRKIKRMEELKIKIEK